jgi:predicted unusual protein kinase regulating ubiquinone biosynthesis (AarF/ABC1/UbiB family)
MQPPFVIALVLLFVIAAALVVLRRAARESSAGIVMSRFGRLISLVKLSLGPVRRSISRRLGGLFLSRAEREVRDRALQEQAARDVARAMGDMKGALMKLGQIISFMDDALPEVYRAELVKLQAQAPPMRWDVVEAALRLELGGDIDRHFRQIDRTPLAAASIGQVHRAVLRDGTAVAVKIQYPGVDRAIAADLDNTGMLIAMIEAVTPTMDSGPVVEELRARLTDELDYTREADNQEAFWRIYQGHPRILIPRVFREHSTRRVLVTELVEGAKGFYEFSEKATPEERRAAVGAIYSFAFDSIYDHYIFNGDPHPGNYLFLPDGRVAFLDFGCVKRFPEHFVEELRKLNRLYMLGEREAYRAQMIEMRYILPAAVDKVDATWLWEYMHYYYLPLKEDAPFTMTSAYCQKAVGAMFGPAMRKLNMPGDFVMLNRINFGLNSVFARLGASENFHRLARRYFFRPGDEERYGQRESSTS